MDCTGNTCGGHCSNLGKGRLVDRFGEYFRRLANEVDVGEEG